MKLTIRLLGAVALLTAILVTTSWCASAKTLNINDLAAKPQAYIGKVTVVGRVAAVTKGKGFTLIDSTNCSDCTTECLTDKNTKKLPFVWAGASPAIKDVVVVQGTLSTTAKGYTFAADKVTKQ